MLSILSSLLNQTMLFRVLFCAAFLFVGYSCLTPLDGPISDFEHMDKVLHVLAFLGLSGLFERAFPTLFKWKGVFLMIGYGALIEILQGQTQYRSASWADLIADSFGVVSYLLFLPIVLSLSKPTADDKV